MEHTALVWLHIPAENLQRAADFYTNVFGYEFFFEQLNGVPHAMFKPDSKGRKPINGAIVEVKEFTRGNSCVLFFDATGKFEFLAENIEKFGGTVLIKKTLITKKIDEKSGYIPNTYIDDKPGYFMHFLDSEGNKMGLYGSN